MFDYIEEKKLRLLKCLSLQAKEMLRWGSMLKKGKNQAKKKVSD